MACDFETLLQPDLGYWVEPWSTMWFLIFCLVFMEMKDGFITSWWPSTHFLTLHINSNLLLKKKIPSKNSYSDIQAFRTFIRDYYYHKSGGYNVVTQTMVDCNKQFIDLFIGSLGSLNGSWMLQKSSLYNKVMHQDLLNSNWGCQDGLSPYILGDKAYLLLS